MMAITAFFLVFYYPSPHANISVLGLEGIVIPIVDLFKIEEEKSSK